MFSPLSKAYLTQGHHQGKAIDLGWISLGISYPEVFSFYDGIVENVWYEKAGGNVVVIRTILDEREDILTLYAHMHRIDVRKGERIAGGHKIGLGGNTGYYRSNGIDKRVGMHLHYEVWKVPKAFVFSTSNYWKFRSFIISPYPLFESTGINPRGIEGANMLKYTIDRSQLGTVKTSFKNLRLRSQPTTDSLSLGFMEGPLTATGLVKEKFNGLEWYQVFLNDRPAFVAKKYVEFEPAGKIVEVIKTVEVEKKLDISTEVDGVKITVKR